MNRRHALAAIIAAATAPAFASPTVSIFPESPRTGPNGRETVAVRLKNGTLSEADVTLENEEVLSFWRAPFGKGTQLRIDGEDFPALAASGLHDEGQLARCRTITGKPVEEITRVGRPGQSSGAGFMAEDEDILSVLTGDNRLVRELGLRHRDLAKPLFHVLNLVIGECRLSGAKRFPLADVEALLYNGREVRFWGEGSRGFQESIFDDEILGNARFLLSREIHDDEMEFLESRYGTLDPKAFEAMLKALSGFQMSEMHPFYIMRYGFYEGHTAYRADPIAIALIFGLRPLAEIESALPGALDRALAGHFTPEALAEGFLQ